MSAPLRIEKVVTKGTFALDDGTWDVDNNIWLVGDDTDVLIVDAAHEAQPIIDAVGGRNVTAVICTHGHNDHVTVAPELGERLHCPVLLHPGDDVLWKMTHPEERYWRLDDGQRIGLAGTEIHVIPHPGAFARIVLSVSARGGGAVLRRHPVQRRARRHRTVVFGLSHDRRLHDAPRRRHVLGSHDRQHRQRVLALDPWRSLQLRTRQ